MTLPTLDLPGLLLLYGYPVLFGTVLVCAFGVPLPATVLLLAAGGFAADGELNLPLVLALTVVGAVAGDCLAFVVARLVGEAVVGRHGHRIGLTPERLGLARGRMRGWHWLAIYITRWLLTPLSLPVTVVAAIDGYPAASFVLASVTGESTWATVYVGSGYLFGEEWDVVSEFLADSIWLIVGVVLVAAAALLAWRVASNVPRHQ